MSLLEFHLRVLRNLSSPGVRYPELGVRTIRWLRFFVCAYAVDRSAGTQPVPPPWLRFARARMRKAAAGGRLEVLVILIYTISSDLREH